MFLMQGYLNEYFDFPAEWVKINWIFSSDRKARTFGQMVKNLQLFSDC